MSKNDHINESILSDEIRGASEREPYNHMEYLPGMEVIDSTVMEQVISAMDTYDYDKYTESDVLRAIAKDTARRKTLRRCFLRRRFPIWRKWHRPRSRRPENIRQFRLYVHAHLYRELLRKLLYLLRIQLP